jgi:hypothetical protein
MRFMLVHSPLVGPTTRQWVAKALQSSGHYVAVPDLRGAATTGAPRAVVRAALQLTGKEPTVLVGHSGAGFFLPSIAAGLDSPVRGSSSSMPACRPAKVRQLQAPNSSNTSARWRPMAPCRSGRPDGASASWRRSFRMERAVL